MGKGDGILNIVSEQHPLALQLVEESVGEHLVDGPHAVGPLGMAGAGVMLDERGVGEKEGGHRIRGTIGVSPCGPTQFRPKGHASLPSVGGFGASPAQ